PPMARQSLPPFSTISSAPPSPGAKATTSRRISIWHIPGCISSPISRTRRIAMAKGALDHGASPRAVFEALRLDAGYVGTLEKLYDPHQPRVPAGHTDGGQWTSGDGADGEESGENAAVGEKPAGAETQGSSVFARMPIPAASPATSFFYVLGWGPG